MKTFVSLSDLHYPYEDPQAVELVTQFLKDFHPDELYLNGDVWDMPQISKYERRRREVNEDKTLQQHLNHGIAGVAALVDAAGAKRNCLALGNHEDRWEAYLGSRAKELASLDCLNFEELFKLQSLEWRRYGEGFWVNDRLFLYHGSYVGSASWTDKERASTGASTITGHMHRQRVTYHRDRSRVYKSIAQGCLCKLDPPYLRTPPDWQQGFCYGYVFDDHRFRVVETEIIREEDRVWMAPEGTLLSAQLASPRRPGQRSSRPNPRPKTQSAATAGSSTPPPTVVPRQAPPDWADSRLSTFLADLRSRIPEDEPSAGRLAA